ncbi:MAG: hypothetical protein NDJ90_00230 [Oligoflexia bacterium]|nr:hypothetical protein [Oligoflexia bacterium]
MFYGRLASFVLLALGVVLSTTPSASAMGGAKLRVPAVEGRIINYGAIPLEELSLKVRWVRDCGIYEKTCESEAKLYPVQPDGSFRTEKIFEFTYPGITSSYYVTFELKRGGVRLLSSAYLEDAGNATMWRNLSQLQEDWSEVSLYDFGQLPVRVRLASGEDFETWLPKVAPLQLTVRTTIGDEPGRPGSEVEFLTHGLIDARETRFELGHRAVSGDLGPRPNLSTEASIYYSWQHQMKIAPQPSVFPAWPEGITWLVINSTERI